MESLPSIRFQRFHKLLEITTTPIRETFFDVGFLLRYFLLREGFGYSQRQMNADKAMPQHKPLSMKSCAACRSSSSFSGVSSDPAGSLNVAVIPLSLWSRAIFVRLFRRKYDGWKTDLMNCKLSLLQYCQFRREELEILAAFRTCQLEAR